VSSVDLGVSQIWPGNGAAAGTPAEIADQFTSVVTGETATATARPSGAGAPGPTWVIVTLPNKSTFQLLLVPVKDGWAVAQVGTGVAFTAALDGPAAFHYEPLSQAASYTAFYRVGDAVKNRTDSSPAARAGTLALNDLASNAPTPESVVVVGRDASGHTVAVLGSNYRVANDETSSATSAPDPAQTLAAWIATQTDVVVHSDPVVVGDLPVAVVGQNRGPDHAITVVSLGNATASPIAELVLPSPSFEFTTDLPVVAADVTGDAAPDFLVRLTAADNQPGVVVSNDGGAWRLVPAGPANDDVYFGRDPSLTNGRLVTLFNDCLPTCAAGQTNTVSWTYDRSSRHFVKA
jgi:hypothetical protein